VTLVGQTEVYVVDVITKLFYLP